MVNYICSNCGKIFKQKGHYTNHMNRKTPCKPIINNISDDKIKEIVNTKIKNLIIFK